MKTIWIYVILLLGIMGCTKDVAVDQFSLREEFNLKTGGIYNASGFELSIKIKEINDSRCPIGVTCIWAGEVAVKFEVNDGTAWDLILRKPSAAVDTVNGYIFTLIDVKPYPKYQEEIPDSEKNVILQIDKL